MKWLLLILSLFAGNVQAQIYRCETPKGVEFSDRPCGETAQVVELEDNTSGIEVGPPKEVREELAARRTQRAEERQERREAAARLPRPAPVPQQVIVEQPVLFPGSWWAPNRPNRPGHPDRPNRPPHHRPPHRPMPPDNGGSMVLKPRP